VITIVGSDDLNLIDAQLIILLGAGRQNAEQGTRDENERVLTTGKTSRLLIENA
jgi:hypothetical protein